MPGKAADFTAFTGTTGDLDVSARAAAGKGPAVHRVRLERYDEGLSVQTLHVGSYDDEAPVLEAIKLKTLLRQPVVPTTGTDEPWPGSR